MERVLRYKYDSDDCILEYDISFPFDDDQRLKTLLEEEDDLDQQLRKIDDRITSKNCEIERYTNDADRLCYVVAIGSGVIAGLVDILYVGNFDFDTAKSSVDKAFDDFVHNSAKNTKIKEEVDKYIKTAKEKGQKVDPRRIEQIKVNVAKKFDAKKDKAASIRYLEKHFGIPSDSAYNIEKNGINSKSHHLDDLAHHPTVVGLFFSILMQFTKKSVFSNSSGQLLVYDVSNSEFIGNTLKGKLIAGTINWVGHLISDMAGSSSSANKGNTGMGLPGFVMSTLKEISSLPIIRKTKLPELLNHLFTADDAIFGNYRLDMRSELAIGKELTKQGIPVFINDVLVRVFYFIRGIIVYGRTAHSIKDIPWNKVIPIGNRTVARMITISVGTMEAIDLADATIRGGIKAAEASGGTVIAAAEEFIRTFLLRINYVGIGRFAVAGVIDTSMGVKRVKLINERIALYNQKLNLMNAKLLYREAEMWISAEKAGQAVFEAYNMIDQAIEISNSSVDEINENLDKIGNQVSGAEERNPGLTDSLLDTLKWG